MKTCLECSNNVLYEDALDLCPECSAVLSEYAGQGRGGRSSVTIPSPPAGGGQQLQQSAYVFEQSRGFRVVLNGAVAEFQVQQYYQSRFTRLMLALFAGEPYQLSHTSFTTHLRIEEHSARGYPERNRNVLMHGNVQTLFAYGDDVEVTARRRRGRLIATRIYNHNTESLVRIQPHIPANVVRIGVVILAVVLYMVISSINFSELFALTGGVVLGLFARLLPVLLIIWVLWTLLKRLFRFR